MKTRAVVTGGILALAGVWAISAVGQAMMTGPAETPPLSFEGREYVDSEGCVFIRAGMDGSVVWVPRVDRNRDPVCGYPPSLSGAQLASASSGSASSGNSVMPPASAASLASSPTITNDLYVPSSMDSYNMVTVNGGEATYGNGRGLVGLINDIFVPSSNSSTETYTTTGDTYPNIAQAGTSETRTYSQPSSTSVANDMYVRPSAGSQSPTGGQRLSVGIPNAGSSPAPYGYVAAWGDDRLNPNRGPRSSTGDQQMRSVWTDSVPMKLAGTNTRAARSSGSGLFGRVGSLNPFTSGKSVQPDGSGGYVQIGTFSDPENVNKNIARLQVMGIALALQYSGTSQVVLAGPFPNGQVTREALSHLRNAGYTDAFIR